MQNLFQFEIDPIYYMIALTGALVGFYRFQLRPTFTRWSTRFGQLDKLNELYIQMLEIEKEIKPNGGTSLRDSIDRIERRIVTLEEKHNVYMRDVKHGLFETDASGRWINVNRTLCRLLKCTESELLSNGWLNFLKDSESFDNYNRAIHNEIEFKGVVNFVNSSSDVIPCMVCVNPLRSSLNKKIIGYLGTVDLTIN